MSAIGDNTETEVTVIESDECYLCGGEAEDEKCEHSERNCGHHCNHYVDGDGCCFCGAPPEEEE